MTKDEVKEQELETSAEDDASSESTALIELNTADLNKESLALINQIIAETDVEKTKDLTYLFNINQNKKTMVRMDKSGVSLNIKSVNINELTDLQSLIVCIFPFIENEKIKNMDEILKKDLLC